MCSYCFFVPFVGLCSVTVQCNAGSCQNNSVDQLLLPRPCPKGQSQKPRKIQQIPKASVP